MQKYNFPPYFWVWYDLNLTSDISNENDGGHCQYEEAEVLVEEWEKVGVFNHFTVLRG